MAARGKTQKKKAKANGRPRAKIDLEQIQSLAQIQCTDYEIALVIGVSERTIERRKAAGGSFLEAYEKGRAEGRTSLRKWQFSVAKAKNTTMLIWLGKQYLNQSDKQDLLSGGQPFRFTIAINGEHKEDESSGSK
jgi:hypothetical protein